MTTKIFLGIKSIMTIEKVQVHRPDNDKYIFSNIADNWDRVIWFSQNVFHVCNVLKVSISNRNYILFNIEAIGKFQNIFFQFSFSRENFFSEKLLTSLFEKTVDVTLKKISFWKNDILQRTCLPSFMKL